MLVIAKCCLPVYNLLNGLLISRPGVEPIKTINPIKAIKAIKAIGLGDALYGAHPTQKSGF